MGNVHVYTSFRQTQPNQLQKIKTGIDMDTEFEIEFFLIPEIRDFPTIRESVNVIFGFSSYLLIGGVFFLKSLILKTSQKQDEVEIDDTDLASLMVLFLAI